MIPTGHLSRYSLVFRILFNNIVRRGNIIRKTDLNISNRFKHFITDAVVAIGFLILQLFNPFRNFFPCEKRV